MNDTEETKEVAGDFVVVPDADRDETLAEIPVSQMTPAQWSKYKEQLFNPSVASYRVGSRNPSVTKDD